MIKITGLNKYYYKGMQNENHVINNMTLELDDFGMIALFGKSGCGKTTLLNLIGGLDSSDSGTITIDQEKVSVNNDYLKNEYIGYIFQNYYLNNSITVIENIKNSLRLCGMRDEEELEKRALIALRNVGMEKYRLRHPSELSGGQQQRVAIARAIVKNPKVILADEPTGNLDEHNTILIMNLLKEISKDRLVLLVTHEANLVDYYCNKVIELKDGLVQSIKENTSSNGYQSKSKNDIYLGEYNHQELQTENVKIDYYGEKLNNDLELRIVNSNGRLYLQVLDDKVSIVNSNSEVHIKEGLFEDTIQENTYQMEAIPEYKGTKFGKLFNLKQSIKDGYNIGIKVKKKSSKLLRIAMVYLSVIFVSITAFFGIGIRDLININSSYNKNIFTVLVGDEATYNEVISLTNDPNSGVTDAVLSNDLYRSTVTDVSAPKFETFTDDSIINIPVRHVDVFPISANHKKTIIGASDVKDNETIISTGFAKEIIANSSYGFIKEMKDVIGLRTTYGNNRYIIIGIVEEDDVIGYVSELNYAKNNANGPIYLASSINREVEDGKPFLYVSSLDEPFTKLANNVIKINGLNYHVSSANYIIPMYEDYALTIDKGFYLSHDFNTYFENKAMEEGISKDDAINKYLVDFLKDYYCYLDDFIKHNNYKTYDYVQFYLACESNDILPLLFILINNTKLEYGIKYAKYLELYESFGDSAEYTSSFITNNINDNYTMVINSNYYALLDTLSYSIYIYYVPSGLYVSDNDYIKITSTVGETNGTLVSYGSTDFKKEFQDDESCPYVLLIYSNNPELTKQKLLSMYGDREFSNSSNRFYTTPDDLRQDNIDIAKANIIGRITSYLISLGLLSVCMYFIVRSSLLKRVREIGIYRAIGTSKKNILFKFFIETFVLSFFTIVLGNVAMSIVYMLLNKTVLISQVLYYPFWLFIVGLIVEEGIALIFGLLPVFSLLRKTPSAILTKYDI